MDEILEDKFNNYLINCQDTDNLIIKGHLLTEHYLNFYIKSVALDKSNKIDRFTYSNKLEVAHVLGLFKKNKQLKKDLLLLNSLRNSLAHNLQYDKNLFKEFVSTYDKIKHPKLSHLSDESAVFIDRKADIYFENVDGKMVERGGKTKVTGGHIKFMMLTSYICGTIYGITKKLIDQNPASD